MQASRKNETMFTAQTITKVGVLSAMAAVLMFYRFPLPFAPTFMKVDLADVPSLIAGFALGPVPGIITVLIKNLIHLLFEGTNTAYVGELSNFIVGGSFVLVSSLIYQKNKSKKGAIAGLIAGTLAMTILAGLSNYFVIFPLYAKAMFGGDVNGFVDMTSKVNNLVSSYAGIMIYAVTPFNLVKGILASVITIIIYKPLSPLLKN